MLSTNADIAIYGGAAGGGKSWALIADPLRYIKRVRGFGAVIFRRTSPEITAEGGIWDQTYDVYPHLGGVPIKGDLEWRFPPFGNTISFRHLEHSDTVLRWQSSQICCLEYDELTHFSDRQFWYMLSRNRSVCGVKPYIRAACNPDPGWVKTLLGPWVDDKFDGPRAESGEIRWFIRVDGLIRWVDVGTPDAKSLTFIRASVYDNQILLRQNPDYIANLKALLPVERARLLDGNWNVRREGLVYPGFDDCVEDECPEPDRIPSVGGIDFGFRNPFAALWGHVDHDDVLWVTGCRYKSQTTLPVHSENLPKNARWWCDPAQPESRVELRLAGHDVVPCVHISGKGAAGEKRSPKLSGIDMVSERIRTGRLRIVRRECIPLIRELGMYHYDETKQLEEPVDEDNHACDALRYLIVGIDRTRSVPAVPQPKPDTDLDDESMWS